MCSLTMLAWCVAAMLGGDRQVPSLPATGKIHTPRDSRRTIEQPRLPRAGRAPLGSEPQRGGLVPDRPGDRVPRLAPAPSPHGSDLGQRATPVRPGLAAGREPDRRDAPRQVGPHRPLGGREPLGGLRPDASHVPGRIQVPGNLFGNDGKPDLLPEARRSRDAHEGDRPPRALWLDRHEDRGGDRDAAWWRRGDWQRDHDPLRSWHHVHFGRDPWFRCGTWFGLSWGYVLCDDPWDQWTWCYRYGGYYPVYVYYPYPYPRYSYVDLGYVDEARAYPPLPAVSYIDDGGSSTTLVDRGNELFHGGDYVSAAEAYRQAILADLSNATAKFGYARALFALGNYPFAALAIRMGMKLAPDWPVVGGDLRDGYGNTQDFTAHAQALDRYRSERPDDPAALLVAGYVHYFTGDFDRAATDFDRLVQANASDEVAKRFAEVAAGARSSAGAQRIAPAAAGDDRGW